MANWGEISGIVAVFTLALVTSQTGRDVLQASRRWLAGHLWPAGLYCRCVSWDDVPEGRIHNCQRPLGQYWLRPYCYCQADSLETVFTGAFEAANGPQNLIEKPQSLQQLGLDRRYVRTDVFTLLAFVLMSADANASGYNINLSDHDTITIASVRCAGRIQPDMTKKTLEGIIAGYPPWYREKLVVAHGPVVPHPIQDRDDVYRAGWVIAVGLSKTEPLSHVVTNNRTMLDESKYINQPLKRVLQKMRDDIQPHFPEHATLKAAISAMEYLIRRGTGSGVETYLTPELHKEHNAIYTSDLSGSDCIFAMSLFNKVQGLSEADRAILSPILTPVIDAAFRGSYQVIQHCKNGLAEFRIPPNLWDFRRLVYVNLG